MGMDMHAEIVDRSPQYRGMDDIERFFTDLKFSSLTEAHSAIRYYRGLLNDPPTPMDVRGGSETIFVDRQDEFMGALTGWYKLSQPNARKMMTYLERTVKGKDDPHDVVSELECINRYIVV